MNVHGVPFSASQNISEASAIGRRHLPFGGTGARFSGANHERRRQSEIRRALECSRVFAGNLFEHAARDRHRSFRCRGSSLRKLKDCAPPSGDAVIASSLPSPPPCFALDSVNPRSLRCTQNSRAISLSGTQLPVIPPDTAPPRETVLPPRLPQHRLCVCLFRGRSSAPSSRRSRLSDLIPYGSRPLRCGCADHH